MTKKFFKHLAIALNLSNELTAEEKLKNLTKEEKHKNLLADIRQIRNSGFYVPNYDKPNPLAKLAQPRPVDFGNDVEAWMKTIREENTFDSKEKERKEKAFQEMMKNRYLNIDLFLTKFTKVN